MKVAIVGASGGIGAAMLEQLMDRQDVESIQATYCNTEPARILSAISDHQETSAGRSSEGAAATDVHWTRLDVTVDADVKAWVKAIGKIDWLINCVGFLHTDTQGPEKSISQLSPEHFLDSMAVNCLPSLLLGKYARAALKDSDRGVFATISARVGSIEDNRLGGWYSYRASKAALNMSLKCLSIEWARNAKQIRVAALHPGTTDTDLSKPFQKNVPEGKLFSTQKTAGLLLEQIEHLHESDSGRFLAYDGEIIPW